MNVTIEQPNERILYYRLRLPDRGVRLDYTINLDRYILSINGEVNCSYKWVETKESFIDLLKRCDKWYIINKLSDRVLDIEKSVEETVEKLRDYLEVTDYDEQLELKEIEDELYNYQTKDAFYLNAVERIGYHYGLTESEIYDDKLIQIYEKYPYWIETAVDLFIEHIVPLLVDPVLLLGEIYE